MTPHEIPRRKRSFEAAFGRRAARLQGSSIPTTRPYRAWNHWARWKLSLMDAYEKGARSASAPCGRISFRSRRASTRRRRSPTGYYQCSAQHADRHGQRGYDDFGPGIFNPSFFLEFPVRATGAGPTGTCPLYGNMPPDRFRLEQCLSFMTNLQGMITPPDMEPARNPTTPQGSSKPTASFQQPRPHLNHMARHQAAVAILYSLSYAIHHPDAEHGEELPAPDAARPCLPIVYMAGKVTQYQYAFVVEEDVLDGRSPRSQAVILVASTT